MSQGHVRQRPLAPPGSVVVGLALTGLFIGLAATALIIAGAQEKDEAVYDVLTATPVGWSFLAVGVWVRWPAGRLGVLTTAVGFAWMLGALNESGSPLVYVAGELVRPLFIALLAHLLLAFPDGRVSGRWNRSILAAMYVAVTALWMPRFLVTPEPNPGCPACPANPIAVVDSHVLFAGLSVLSQALTAAAWLGVVASLLVRRRAATGARRRALTAALCAGVAASLFFASTVAAARPGLHGVTEDVVAIVGAVGWSLVPFLLLAGAQALSGHPRRAWLRSVGSAATSPTATRSRLTRWTIFLGAGLLVALVGGLVALSVASPQLSGRPSAPPSEGESRIEAEGMSAGDGVRRIVDSGASGGSALRFGKNGLASIAHATSGAGTVVVRARGDQCQGAPSMALEIDGRRIPLPAVSATSWTSYPAPIHVADGPHRIEIAYINNFVGGDCDRNLYVDRVTFAPAPRAASRPTPTYDPATTSSAPR